MVHINITLCSTATGILVGCIFNDLETALNVAPLVFFPMMLFSGFYVNSESVRDWVKWIEYISAFRYSLESLVYNEYESSKYNPNPINTYNFKFGYWSANLYLFLLGLGIRMLGFVSLLINARSA